MDSYLAYENFINLPVCKSYTVTECANLFIHSTEIGIAHQPAYWLLQAAAAGLVHFT